MDGSSGSPLSERERILHEPLPRTFWRLSVPSVLGLGLLGINGFVDALAVGRVLGEQALAGAGVGFALANLPLAIGNLIGTGAAAVLSNAVGAKDDASLRRLFGSVLALCVGLGVVVAVACIALAPVLVAALGATGPALDAGVTFFRVQAAATPLIGLGLGLNMMVRGEGKVRQAMLMAGGGALANMALAFPLCHALGTGGAALAGVVASGIYVVTGLWWYARGPATVKLALTQFAPDGAIVKSIVQAGMPSFVMGSMALVQMVLVYRALAAVGDAHDAALYGALARVSMLATFPVFGLMRAFQPVVGIAWGARRGDLVGAGLRVFVGYGVALIACLLVPLSVFTADFLGMVLPGTVITDVDVAHARVFLIPFLGYPVVFMGLTVFQNSGAGTKASLLALSRQLLLFIPAIFFLPPLLGVRGVYAAYAGVDVVVIAITAVLLLVDRRRWHARSGLADQAPAVA